MQRILLSILASAVNYIFKYQFHNIHRKNQRPSKIPKSSDQYFTPSDVIHYGLITIIHSFGRDLKRNTHIHAIVSLGGFNKFFHFLNFQYFHAESIDNQWKYLGCYLARAPIAEYKISSLSHDSASFFFYDLKMNKKKTFITMP